MKNIILKITVLALILVSCKDSSKTVMNEPLNSTGINLEFMDTTVSPKHDFFKHINGSWLDKNKIPEDRTQWGSVHELFKNTDSDVLAILKKEMKSNTLVAGSDQEKAVQLYQSILNIDARNKAGVEPLELFLSKIDKIETVKNLQTYLTEMQGKSDVGFFSTYIGSDSKDSNKNVVYLGTGSLGLPDRDYYVKEDVDSKEKRVKYLAHITRMLQFLGDSESDANKQAQKVLAFEIELATPRLDKVESRDARKRYNPRSINELQELVPAINWKTYFEGLGIKTDTVIVSQLKYTETLQTIFAKNNISDWKAYLRWTALKNASGSLSEEIEKANWNFYSKTLRGAKKQRPREENALSIVNRTMGEALGQLYVSEKFPPEAKEKAQEMIVNVLKAFENRINNVSWMSTETKVKAIEKLNATTVKVGYPDKWKDYSDLEIGTSYFQNKLNASAWRFNENIVKLNKPVDKTEWHMSPQTVNAYFNPSYNEIVFPAAILQPPFYDYNADDAVNYGGIGAVIGHEISHSFDDSGARYDKDGNLNDWWTESDLLQFEALGKALVDQYSAVEVLPGTNINGAFTLGENIGDLGGVNVGYDALQLVFVKNGRPENIDGFTAEQRYFMSWATIWRIKYRDEALKNQIKTDPHSPGMVRAVQPLKNVDTFYEAFNVKEGDEMYISPENRVKIW